MTKVIADKSQVPTDSKVVSKKQLVLNKLKGFGKELVVIAIIFFGITVWQTRDMLATDGSVQIDATVLPSLAGSTMPLVDDSKPTLIYFFAPWCSVCKLSIGNLDGLNTDKLDVVTVALDYDSVEAVQAFVQGQKLTVPVLLGSNDLKRQFQIKGYPSYYLLNKDRKVVSKSYGYSTALGMKLRAWVNG